MSIYVTSDTHFGHANIINLCRRPYENVDIMDQSIIDTINKMVKPTDTLYHLGDFCWWNKKQYVNNIITYREKITCQNIILLLGNHDMNNRIPPYLFSGIYENYELNHDRHRMILSHYPFQSWNKKQHGSLHFHGHTHNQLKSSGLRRLDVGWDTHLKPLLISEAIEMALQNGGKEYNNSP